VLLGKCTVTLRELEGKTSRTFPLRGIRGSGFKLTVEVSFNVIPTVEDYIASGTQINLVIAIDFTESNRDPKMKDSLHYIGDNNKENDYQQAIRNVGTM
jgi:hypothetical protein